MSSKRSKSKKSKNPAANQNQGEFAGMWVSYDDVYQKVDTQSKIQVLQCQFIRFLIFGGLLLSAIELNTRVTPDFEVYRSMQETYLERPFVADSFHQTDTTYKNFAEIKEPNEFWMWINSIVMPQSFDHEKKVTPTGGHKFTKAWYVGQHNQLLWGIRIRQQRTVSFLPPSPSFVILCICNPLICCCWSHARILLPSCSSE
jgi:hypothetical protein